MALYRVDVHYGCFGIISDRSDTVVERSAPMPRSRFPIGTELWKILSYYRKQNAKIEKELPNGEWFPIH